MNVPKKVIAVGLLLVLSVSVLVLGGCGCRCCPPRPTPTFTPTSTQIVPTPTPEPLPPTPSPTPPPGAFRVEPQDDLVYVQAPQETSWQEIRGEGGYADWEYRVKTSLSAGARIYSLDAWWWETLMRPSTEIQLPTKLEGYLTLVGGGIAALLDKRGGKIVSISSGGEYVDPEFAVFELTYDAAQETTEIIVYGGVATVTRPATGESWIIEAWQRASFEPETIPKIQAMIEPPPPEVQDWLIHLELPTRSPWQLDFELETDPTLDPIFATDLASQQSLHQLMEGLLSVDPEGNIIPAGATRWEVSEDGLEWTFHLRKDASWSDGVPVTAHDYVDGICRAADPAFGAEQAYLLHFIAGFKEFNTGETPDCSSVGIQAIDDYTLQISVVEPLTYLPNLLITPLAYPVHLDIIEQCGPGWIEPDCFVSNGPYTLRSWEHGYSLTLEKNPYYWNANSIEIDSLEFFIK